MRVAVINTHPIQHFAPLWRELAKTGEVELKVFYCCDWGINEYLDPGFGTAFKWDIDLLGGYNFEFLPIKTRPQALGFWEVDNPDIGDALRSFRPDVLLLFGYSHLTNWRALFWARRHGIRVLTFGDSELKHDRSVWRLITKEVVVRLFFAMIDGALPIGNCNAEYYQRYGVPADLLHWCAYPVDGARLLSAVDNAEAKRFETRSKLGIGADEFIFASVGKYIPRKRHDDVIRAWRALPASLQSRSRVLLVGEGPQRPELEKMAAPTESRIILTGFVNQQEMPFYYNACDVLIVASDIDAHPLVVTESLFLGLPVIVSHRAGCIGPDDTVRAGENALVYRCGDIAALTGAMERLMKDDGLRQRFSNHSRAIAQGQDAMAVSKKLVKAFGEVTASEQATLLARGRRAISV